MQSVTVKEIYRETDRFLNQKVELSGWVRTVRSSKAFGFIEINDGSFFENIQIVFEDSLTNFSEIGKMTISSALRIQGTLVPSPGAKQPFELKADFIEVLALSAADYPLQKKRHTFEYLRTIAHLRPRTNTYAAVFRVRSVVAYAIHKFFQEKGYVYVHTPIITGSDAEGAGEMFRVTALDSSKLPLDKAGNIDFSKDFFGRVASLTVSGQLNVETYCMAFRNVYTFGPTFRAENSNTTRHAAEFWMIEPEIAFADLVDDMHLAEEMMKFIIQYALDNAPEEMAFFNNFIDKTLFDRLENILGSEFGHITYTEAVELLEKENANFMYPVHWGTDLQTEHERYLTEKVLQKPVFVSDYPKGIKAFYMRLNEDNKTVAAMDLLVPGVGEIIGGSQREERLDVLQSRMKDFGLNAEDYWWYLDIRKYGGVKHAGYGLGFERMIMYLTGMSNIRDVISFPRTVNSCEF
ncbi:MAG: asparagine--tRNA ligase [Desulfosporosinus sp.]